jgi:hypothetical protein
MECITVLCLTCAHVPLVDVLIFFARLLMSLEPELFSLTMFHNDSIFILIINLRHKNICINICFRHIIVGATELSLYYCPSCQWFALFCFISVRVRFFYHCSYLFYDWLLGC